MLHRLRRHVNPATILASAALVFAATGGAFAATNSGPSGASTKASASARVASARAARKRYRKRYLITSTRQISPKVLASLRGKRGAAGPAGKDGATGAPGVNGANGAAGAKGEQGSKGEEGKAGKEGEEGEEGPRGKEGKEGSPWTAGGTLPSKATETGMWVITVGNGGGVVSGGPISFTIPLAKAVAQANIKIEPEGYTGTSPECPGSAEDAKAEAGFLCIYTAEAEGGLENPEVSGSTVDGAVLLKLAPVENTYAFGSWAVTAE